MAKPKKYAHVVKDLPKLGIDPDRKAIVTAVQAEILAPVGNIDDDPAALPPLEHVRMLAMLVDDVTKSMNGIIKLQKRATFGRRWASELARAYVECRNLREQIDEWGKLMGVLVEAYQWLMIEQFSVEGVSMMRLDNGQPVSTWDEPNAKVEDHAKFLEWCLTPADTCMTCKSKAHEHIQNVDTFELQGADGHTFAEGGGLQNKLQLHWGVTNAIVKERLLLGVPEPPGVVAYALTKVRLGSE